jgi:hypothetical protein
MAHGDVPRFHSISGCTNAPQYFITRTLPILFVNSCHLENMTFLASWDGIAWRIERLTTGWTV